MYDIDTPWIPCALRNPTARGTYLVYEPVGPSPFFEFLRWDGERGWRDHCDNKGFPSHWARLTEPKEAEAYGKDDLGKCPACGIRPR